MYRPAKQLVKKLFSACGLEIHKKQPEFTKKESEFVRTRATLGGVLRHFSNLGFKPQTVIDVVVAFATPELYEEFRESGILLIEPLVEFEPFVRNICNNYGGQYVLAAAGKSSGTAVLNVHKDQLDCSSYLKEVEGPTVDGSPRRFPLSPSMSCVWKGGLKGPYLIKVDVQGAVLARAKRTLQETELVILEVTLFGIILGGPQLYDIVSSMKERGFVVYDVFGSLYRPFDKALCQVDMAFVREQGPFRQSHVFATPGHSSVEACLNTIRMKEP
jgi:hypothetical protein